MASKMSFFQCHVHVLIILFYLFCWRCFSTRKFGAHFVSSQGAELWGCAEAQSPNTQPGSIGAACRMRAACCACCAQHNATYGRIVKLYGRTTRGPAARQITGLKSNAGASSAPNYRVEKQRGGQQRAKFPG